jgi:glycosyltransferase involved in cell wall biosynthesis
MVGTIEPRKGYAQVLEAFEHLWQQGSNAQLVIVGKQGWMMEQWVDNVRSHLRLGKQLFWLEAISDEFLEALYGKSSCLITASEGEGFGLPLIEAAMHHLPIIARDIPVFREVAGEHALYFSGGPLQLAKAIEQWLGLAAKNAQPHSEKMGWSTWKQSAQSLLELVLES